jgi:KUP system potassium uptake protein
MVSNLDVVPSALLHNLKHNKVLHERVVLMKVEIADIPHVPDARRIEGRELADSFFAVTLHYGFMDEPNVPRALAQLRLSGFECNLMEISFFVGREKLTARRSRGLMGWHKRLFILLYGVKLSATEFLRIPSNRVVELGGQIEI